MNIWEKVIIKTKVYDRPNSEILGCYNRLYMYEIYIMYNYINRYKISYNISNSNRYFKFIFIKDVLEIFLNFLERKL